ncbi:lysocardiolipin acyltransferase 1 isoform X6 [Chrysemys picta bellii]
MNHRTRMDWMFLWNCLLRYSYLRLEKICLKSSLKSVPGFGWAMQVAAFIFIQRKWEDDKNHFENMLDYFCDIHEPLQLLIFPEGTDLTANTKARSNEFAEKNGLRKYKYVLHPRTTGFTFVVERLREGAAATTTPPLTVDAEDGILSTAASSEMLADGEDEEGEEEDEAVDSAYNADFPDSQDLFITLTEIPYQPSPGSNPDPESGEGSVAANVSRPTLASPSQRLAQFRRRKKRTRDDMFSELMGCSRADAAQQTQWRENMSQYQRAHSEREERWRQEDQQVTQTLLGLMREQTDTLRRLVDVLQDRRQEDRAPLQSLTALPRHKLPYPPHPKSQEGGAAGAVKTVTPPLQTAQVPEGSHSQKFDKSFPSRLTQAPVPVSSPNCVVANKRYVSVNYCFHHVLLGESVFEGGKRVGNWRGQSPLPGYRHGGRFSRRSHTHCSH